MRGPQYKELEEKLLEWFHQMLEAKADYFALQLQVDDFKCSNGWLQRFMQRNNLVYKTVCGESTAVDNDAAVSWLDSVQPVVSKYVPCDIFNMDGTGRENCHGGKHSTACITVLLCCDQDGSMKLRPPVIDKSKNPRCFKVMACRVQQKIGNFEQKCSSALISLCCTYSSWTAAQQCYANILACKYD
ncbi:hypothetical protein PR048_018369 [Dryococelus australis]|uniref:HTH CENPB-type domain-containing protein n=1 Tax=Dryococelus australis TaxID=614101 RepID=A0ABQ9HC54_9NEOP|nr:hypothetical protein PR048_018369 [Dryococelus australis]